MAINIVTSRQYKRRYLDLIRQLLTGFRVRLFVNNIQPADTDTVATYQEASFPGYAPVVARAWTAPATTATGAARTALAACVFTQVALANPVQTIYGYFLTDTGNRLVYSQRESVNGFALIANKMVVTYSLAIFLIDIPP